MSKTTGAVIFLLLFLFSFSQSTRSGRNTEALLNDYQKADKLYQDAEDISYAARYDEEKEAALNLSSLRIFEPLGRELETLSPRFDSLLFHCQIKTAILYHYFDSNSFAKNWYLKGLNLQRKTNSIPDSFTFSPLIYLGGILYTESKFDSARILYRLAEKIAASSPVRLAETERLMNTLGALYFESGNYSEASHYFTKAIQTMQMTGESGRSMMANYKINLAATYTKLEEYEKAGRIYEELLRDTLHLNDILHNTGNIRFRTGKPEEALQLLRRVHYPNRTIIRLYNDISQVFIGMEKEDSALYYLQLAVAENNKWNKSQKNLQHGITLRYLGDLHLKENAFDKALASYQMAITQFTPGFDNEDPASNPVSFTGIFSYINLFYTLCNKAEAFAQIYHQDNRTETLNAAFAAYQSAFRLAEYVEQTYNSDEARLFIGKIKHDVHNRPIDIGIQLFKLTKKKEFLEQVYLFDQRNKASVLSLNNTLQQINESSERKDPLFIRKAAIQSSITRLSLRSETIRDSSILSSLSASIRDQEIELGKVNEEINADPLKRQALAAEKIPSINQLHRKLDNSTAILSYHLSENDLLILIVTAGKFDFRLEPINKQFYEEIEQLKTALHQYSGEQRYSGNTAAGQLWKLLIGPAEGYLAQIKRLIIIPDDELHYLPFEVLQDERRRYLIEKYAIQYQYSTALLGNQTGSTGNQSLVSFAPFSKAGYNDSNNNLSRLPASAEEISNLNGRSLLDDNATREQFLQFANHNRVIHLATHASVNNENPLRSYISFYPGNSASRLYAREIYDLQLDTTDLIILSACETGTGQLVKGEGMMSLSRAFAYAGCPNIITSLWKAEDRATAYITQRLHYYLGKNETKDKALQMAKIDFLKTQEIDPSLKSPNYWAHLVLIGEYEPDHKRSNWPWVATGIVIILLTYYFLKKKNLPGRSNRQV
ncbi:MAG: CHAT domain-containing protein [Chitinophagaceae bacterium]|nr:CHAT domain-containing protein [Chitinophagaceae bacterium]